MAMMNPNPPVSVSAIDDVLRLLEWISDSGKSESYFKELKAVTAEYNEAARENAAELRAIREALELAEQGKKEAESDRIRAEAMLSDAGAKKEALARKETELSTRESVLSQKEQDSAQDREATLRSLNARTHDIESREEDIGKRMNELVRVEKDWRERMEKLQTIANA